MSDQTVRYGSDVMVDVMKSMGFRYVSLNPGSSYRALHDSLVNYGENSIEMIECPHEEIAVQIAHGYAKASGEPMAVILHDLVGLLHGAMAIYYAYIDRAPVVIFGGSGPAAYDRRRPNIDWIHSANVQGNAVRDFTKWDAQPSSLSSVADTVARAYRVATAAPTGPVYVALDAGLQEDVVPDEIELPDFERVTHASAIGPEPTALAEAAQLLMSADRPVIVPFYAGRDPELFALLPELASTCGAAIMDTGIRLNAPNRHAVSVDAPQIFEDADCVLFLDGKDLGKPVQKLDSTKRRITSLLPARCRVIDMGFNDVGLSSWSEDYGALMEADVRLTTDAAVGVPALLASCRLLAEREAEERTAGRAKRRQDVEARGAAAREQWSEELKAVWGQAPMSTARLAAEVWSVVKNYDWVLSAGTAEGWARRLWDFDQPYRHPGESLGTATQIGISLGVALAHKESDRLVVALQPDGDLMFDVGALWVAAYYELPILVVMVNNRAYDNDWEHQVRMARLRGTPEERASIGMEIDGPAPDFAAIARGFGWHAEGPIENPDELADAVRRAAQYVQENRKPALVDAVVARRSSLM